ncbi:MAG: hypothetical protein IPO17_04105 [Flavobacteriales bacterium]|nr:hypothetical protein [Flavobacteriales bacterium]
MKHNLLPALSVVLLMSCQTPGEQTPTNHNDTGTMSTTNDEATIKELLFAYRDALNASSVDQVMPLHHRRRVHAHGLPDTAGTEQVRARTPVCSP